MPTDTINKINLTDNTPDSGSILVPKIELNSKSPEFPSDDPPATPVVEDKKPMMPKGRMAKKKKIILGVLAFFGIFLIYNIIAGFIIYGRAMTLSRSLKELNEKAASKDLVQIKGQLTKTKGDLSTFGTSLKLVGWAKIIPYYGKYVSDADHGVKAGKAGLEAGEIVVGVIEPYSDLLGFLGGDAGVLGAKTAEQTTQDRIDFIVKTIPDLLPKIDEISAKVQIVDSELDKIDHNRYPEKFQGKELRSKLKLAKELVNQTAMFVVNGKPALEQAPYILGMDAPRTYFILFQNDKELRPTGGFLTAYAIMKVDKAKFEPVSSNDIYNLDAIYKPSIPAPDPIVRYIKGPYILSKNLRLRDMNWSPDFPTSMDTFTKGIDEAGVKNIDGIISVDTQLLTNLLSVIGPIGVPGFGNFSNEIVPECNCPQAVYELESFADVEGPIVWDPNTGKIVYKPKNADNRKSIIGPLMNSVMANALGQPKEKLPALFEAGFKSLIEKHVLFYMFNEGSQTALKDFGLGGAIREYEGDYLHINDANLGGRKSNLYATEDVDQLIEVARDGTITKTLTITYKNPEKHDGWLNSVLPNWVRVYVPKGSELIAAEGLEEKEDPYEDLNKTVFAGGFQLRPEGVSKITFKYKLPFKADGKEYKLLIQKQPGTDGFLYSIKLGRYQDEFLLKTDKEIKIGL
jgi:hypothetical protein